MWGNRQDLLYRKRKLAGSKTTPQHQPRKRRHFGTGYRTTPPSAYIAGKYFNDSQFTEQSIGRALARAVHGMERHSITCVKSPTRQRHCCHPCTSCVLRAAADVSSPSLGILPRTPQQSAIIHPTLALLIGLAEALAPLPLASSSLAGPSWSRSCKAFKRLASAVRFMCQRGSSLRSTCSGHMNWQVQL
jgi:hypothetical protein